jgi:hypothetical protein
MLYWFDWLDWFYSFTKKQFKQIEAIKPIKLSYFCKYLVGRSEYELILALIHKMKF